MTVERIAALHERTHDEPLLLRREGIARRLDLRLDVLITDPAQREIADGRSHRRSAGDDAVEQVRIALRHDHAFASAGRTAYKVVVMRRGAVVRLDDRTRDFDGFRIRLQLEIQQGLLIGHEAAVEAAALMTAVRRDDREAALDRRPVTGCLRPDRLADRAVQPTAALEHEPAVPFGRHVDRETYRVFLAVDARSALEATGDVAVRRQRHLGARPSSDRAIRIETRLGDRQILGAGGPAGERSTGSLLRPGLRLGRRVHGERRNRESSYCNELHCRHRLTRSSQLRWI